MAKNKGHENLTPFTRNDDRASIAGKKGVQAAHKKRKENKTLNESLNALLSAELSNKQLQQYKELGFKVESGDKITFLDLASARAIAKVIATGDIQGLQQISIISGKHTESIGLNAPLNNTRPLLTLKEKEFDIIDVPKSDIKEIKEKILDEVNNIVFDKKSKKK